MMYVSFSQLLANPDCGSEIHNYFCVLFLYVLIKTEKNQKYENENGNKNKQ